MIFFWHVLYPIWLYLTLPAWIHCHPSSERCKSRLSCQCTAEPVNVMERAATGAESFTGLGKNSIAITSIPPCF